MSKITFSLVAGALIVAVVGPALGANRKAVEMVDSSMKEQAALLAKFPALTQIDNAVRSDCAAKNPGKSSTGDFCGCGSAVTMQLWRSGVDPKMMPRLQAYLKNPTESGAAEFVQYQGLELYAPVCKAADKR